MILFVYPQLSYNVDSIGDAYGVLKIAERNMVTFQLCDFDLLQEGPEPEEIKVVKEKQQSKNQ